MKHILQSLLFTLSLLLVGVGNVWGEEYTGTIKFGTNDVKINAASVTGEDNLGNTWTITTEGTTSFTAQPTYYQVGSKDIPATIITFTTTLAKEVSVTSMSAKFGGFSGTVGTITMKVGNISIGTGNLNAANDVTVSSTSSAQGNVLTVTITGIDKGVKCYNISYSYEEIDEGEIATYTNILDFITAHPSTTSKLSLNDASILGKNGQNLYIQDETGGIIIRSNAQYGEEYEYGKSITATFSGIYTTTIHGQPEIQVNSINDPVFGENPLAVKNKSITNIENQTDQLTQIRLQDLTFNNNTIASNQVTAHDALGNTITIYDTFKVLTGTSLYTDRTFSITGLFMYYDNVQEICPQKIDLIKYDKVKTTLTYSSTTSSVSVGRTLTPSTTITTGYNGSITYESDKPEIATVSTDGTITGVSVGTATITVRASETDNYEACETSFEITVTSAEEGSDGMWIMVDHTKVEKGKDIILIVDLKTKCAMSNDNGTQKAPSAVQVTIVDNDKIYDASDNLKWTMAGGATTGYSFTPVGVKGHLYANDANNGLRIGSGTNQDFLYTIETNYNGLKEKGTNRFVGVFIDNGTPQDWRCYTSVNDNINNTNIHFFKWVEKKIVKEPVFSVAPGNFSEAFELKLSQVDDKDIYYCLNDENGTFMLYSEPINISETTTVYAYAQDGENKSNVISTTYTYFDPNQKYDPELYFSKITYTTSINVPITIHASSRAGSNGSISYTLIGEDGYASIDSETGVFTSTKSGVYTVTATIEANQQFEASSAEVTVIVSSGGAFIKVNSCDELKDGDEIIIATPTDKRAFGSISSGSYKAEAVPVEMSNDGSIITNSNSATIFTLKASGTSFALHVEQKGYLYRVTTNSSKVDLAFQNTENIPNTGIWTPTEFSLDSGKEYEYPNVNGTIYFKNNSASTRGILYQYNTRGGTTASNVFANYITEQYGMYVDQAHYKPVAVYVKKKDFDSFSITKSQWGTFYTEDEFEMPNGVEGYFVTPNADHSSLSLNKVYDGGKTVPAKTPLLIRSVDELEQTKDFYYLITQKGEPQSKETNYLRGQLTAGMIAEEKDEMSNPHYYYKLSNGTHGLGWYLGNTSTGGVFKINNDKRAYLVIPKSEVYDTKGFGLNFDIETAIQGWESEHANYIYDLSGRRLAAKPKKGLYIMNGKKYVVK